MCVRERERERAGEQRENNVEEGKRGKEGKKDLCEQAGGVERGEGRR